MRDLFRQIDAFISRMSVELKAKYEFITTSVLPLTKLETAEACSIGENGRAAIV